MAYLKIALAAAGMAVAASGFAAWHLAFADDQRGALATGQPGRTVGDRRLATLVELTEAYVAETKDVAPRIAAGEELAPPAFLNEQLAERNAKWRVREVEGLTAETYIVS